MRGVGGQESSRPPAPPARSPRVPPLAQPLPCPTVTTCGCRASSPTPTRGPGAGGGGGHTRLQPGIPAQRQGQPAGRPAGPPPRRQAVGSPRSAGAPKPCAPIASTRPHPPASAGLRPPVPGPGLRSRRQRFSPPGHGREVGQARPHRRGPPSVGPWSRPSFEGGVRGLEPRPPPGHGAGRTPQATGGPGHPAAARPALLSRNSRCALHVPGRPRGRHAEAEEPGRALTPFSMHNDESIKSPRRYIKAPTKSTPKC